eukprot:3668731-Amphidinium_carterae.6
MGKLQSGPVPFKLMRNDTSVRTRMSRARVVEPTTNDLSIDDVHHCVAKVSPKASRKAPKTISDASIAFMKMRSSSSLVHPTAALTSSEIEQK